MTEIHYRYVQAGANFRLSGVRSPGFPLLLHPTKGVCPDCFAFMRELSLIQGNRPGTLRDVAGILCQWLNLLSAAGRGATEPDERLYLQWARNEGPGAQAARRARRAEVVFRFYEFLARDRDGQDAICDFVNSLAEPISQSAREQDWSVRRKLRLSIGRRTRLPTVMRPTPNEDAIERIAEALLGDGSRYSSIRNWHVAQTAFETGMRRQGLAQLDLRHLHVMLTEHGVSGLDSAIARPSDRATKVAIRADLAALEASGYENLVCDGIYEKGRVRSVCFPIPTVRRLLEHVWSERARFLDGRGALRRDPLDAPMWLSVKTGDRLSEGSISDILKQGFDLAGEAGSGHRLRAAFAVRLFRAAVRKARERGGGKFDAEVILLFVAERMGQSDPRSLRPYLHSVMLEDLVA